MESVPDFKESYRAKVVEYLDFLDIIDVWNYLASCNDFESYQRNYSIYSVLIKRRLTNISKTKWLKLKTFTF